MLVNLEPTVILKNDMFLRQREDERARVRKRWKQNHKMTAKGIDTNSVLKNQEEGIYRGKVRARS